MEHTKSSQKGWKRLTIDQLRKYKGLESLSDEEANEAIIALEKLSVIMFELWQNDLREKEENKV